MKMTTSTTKSTIYRELSGLFFETRQIIRQNLPGAKQSDPNGWVRLQAMEFIGRTNEPTMHDVAGYLRVKAPSATSLVAHLVSQGLIQRHTGKDRREVVLSLTENGKKVLKQYSTQSEEMMRTAFSTLDEDEVCSLGAILKKLIHGHSGHNS